MSKPDFDFHFRRARSDEMDYLSELAMRSKAYWGYSPEFMEACRDELTLTPEKFQAMDVFLLEFLSDGTAVGVSALESLEPEEPGRVELGLLFVEPEWIGRGLGRFLMARTIEEARLAGFRILETQGDPNAERFYRAAGCVRVGERASDSIPGRMLPVLELDLRAGD